MQELRLVGIADDGEHLLLTDETERYLLPLDEELRTTMRRSHRVTTAGAATTRPSTPLRPRDIQALIRGGVPLDEIAERAGWPLEKVRRYEGPIRAERDYVCERAKSVVLPSRTETVTLRERAAVRLEERGVEAERVVWDSWKSDETHWTVVVRFPAGGRLRQATWLFDPSSHALHPVDDEARWLGGDELTPAAEDVVPRRAQAAHLGSAAPASAATATSLPGTGVSAVEPVEVFDVGTTPPPFPSHPRPQLDAEQGVNAADSTSEPAVQSAETEDGTAPTPGAEPKDAVEEDHEVSPAPQETPPRQVPERPNRNRSGRPSVPSWDDIMFGGRNPKG